MRQLFQVNDGRRLVCDSQIFSFCLKLGEKQKGTGKSGKHFSQNDVDLTELNDTEQQSGRVPSWLNVKPRICQFVRLPPTKSFTFDTPSIRVAAAAILVV